MVNKTKNIPSFWWLLLGLIVIASISIRRNFELTNPAVAPPAITNSSQLKKMTETSAMFYSKIFLDRNKTFVYLPIKFENQTQVSWLLLDSSSSATPTTWLIAHPTMEKISWPAIIDKTVYLYQKKPTYQTMSDFVKNPPPETKVLVEKSLKKIYPYSTIQGSDLPANFDQQAVDFILTTYKHSTIKDGVIQYENTIDATNGKLNAGDKLTWYLNVPSATKDNPFYIGEIHIDYR